MNVKQNFYSNKKYKHKLLEKYLGQSEELDIKINILIEDLKNGFTLYSKRNLERFIQGYTEINDFALQFIKLEEYYSTHNKYSNSEELYKLLYGETIGNLRWQEKLYNVQGEKNPWHNHGGKFSPLSNKSEVHSEETRVFVKEKIKETKKDPARRGNKTIEYWLRKGYIGEEANNKLAKAIKAGTFTLEKCITKYGKEEGTRIWKERQINWQNTLKNKTQEEIDDINRRKSSGIGRYLDRNIPGKLYYIKFFNKDIEFWKIGITSINLFGGRFENPDVFKEKYKLDYEIIFENNYNTIQEAYNIEQKILRNNNVNRITIDYNKFYTTETFDRNIIKEINEIIANNN